MLIWLWAIFLMGCTDRFDPPQEVDCEQPVAYYPDENGDGLGESSDIYVGCFPPKGWVPNVEEAEDTGDPPDTGQENMDHPRVAS